MDAAQSGNAAVSFCHRVLTRGDGRSCRRRDCAGIPRHADAGVTRHGRRGMREQTDCPHDDRPVGSHGVLRTDPRGRSAAGGRQARRATAAAQPAGNRSQPAAEVQLSRSAPVFAGPRRAVGRNEDVRRKSAPFQDRRTACCLLRNFNEPITAFESGDDIWNQRC